ncbi:hypothetical protein SAMN02745181_2541 [Rubritalea squalenifaciens DSM 18772]|uniref:Uncharacterized protein n=1 Tax=Rubritalea squalenifaciens DSM 18772 TaxID=1123071 RepID=A0A1M6LYD1_9BACT|nr:hypothetical protein [Rubritalea squalenifaciens]SHJ76175.1 hypothetical protein SAMN02745181_2541 [Rubritalea squalenifaciens DSM 18772]
MFRKTWLVCMALVAGLTSGLTAGEIPEVFKPYFEEGKPVRAEIVTVAPPKEFEGFIQKLGEAAQKDPEWFKEHSKKTPAGSPIPVYDTQLGMTEDEYNNYVKLWDQRKVVKQADVALMLTKESDNVWKINGSGPASNLTLLRYQVDKDAFTSTNGELKRIADIAAPAHSMFGAWNGKEWRYLSENSLGKIKENIALGMTGDKKYGMLVYRLQEVTAAGRPLLDRSMVIRFLPVK